MYHRNQNALTTSRKPHKTETHNKLQLHEHLTVGAIFNTFKALEETDRPASVVFFQA